MKINSQNIIEFINSGKSKNKYLGIEIEHFILDDNNETVFQSYPNKKAGIKQILEELSVYYKKKLYSKYKNCNYLIGLIDDEGEISLEAGAQLEFSLPPLNTIKEIDNVYTRFLDRLNVVLKKYSYHIQYIGYRPDKYVFDVPLIPSIRYDNMDAYFRKMNQCGCCLMRSSAATQITIDFVDEHDYVLKAKIASILAPLFYFLYDNVKIYEKTDINNMENISKNGFIVPKRMVRWYL